MKKLKKTFVTLDDLFHAYRKAKIDAFFERSQPLATAFCEYEQNLSGNLKSLQKTLCSKEPEWFSDEGFIGSYGFIPKGLGLPDKSDGTGPHFSSSNPDDTWKILLTSSDEPPTIEFRPVASFTVDMCVVCALWVNIVGHKYDACLDSSAYGSRLRRLGPRPAGKLQARPYHLKAPGSFQPYFYCYRQWRENGLKAIRHELSEDRRVIAVTMDLASFYHNVDPRFLLTSSFLKSAGFNAVNGSGLTEQERSFTEQLVTSFETWSHGLPHTKSKRPAGVPVGPSAPRVIANVILAPFDRFVQQRLDPIYYGRYVDDIFLVLRDNGRIKRPDDLLQHLCRRIPSLELDEDEGELRLQMKSAAKSKLRFKTEKQRIFMLAGEIGHDLLDTIESKIDEVSSEWRLLPDLDALARSPAARVLTAAKRPNEDADALRKADELSLRRLGFSLLLRNTHALSRDLPPGEWKKERQEFYRFAERHVLTPIRFFDLNDYLPRLLGLAVASREWRVARRIVRKISSVVQEVRSKVAVRPKLSGEIQWDGFCEYLARALTESVLTSYPVPESQPSTEKAASRLLDLIADIGAPSESIPHDVAEFASKLFWADLARIPFKDAVLDYESMPKQPTDTPTENLPPDQQDRESEIRAFLESSAVECGTAYPFLFATRPLTVPEITEISPPTITDLSLLGRLVRAFRGTWVKPNSEDGNDDDDGDMSESGLIEIGVPKGQRAIRIAATSFLVDDASWSRAAANKPDLSRNRYMRLVRLANDIVTAPSRPNYVAFPELSIPRRWLPGLAHHFLRANISLIAGAEYRHVKGEKQVINEAHLFLTDNRLGYPSWCVVRQRKGEPAHHERDNLRRGFGLSLPPIDPNECNKHVYRHFGHDFGLLVCSELTDISFRQQMRGEVDTLFVLCWNQDLESFSSLVEATVLDVHSFMALVNNRKYGDSRVRGPMKQRWRRDIVRVKGGLDDYFAVAELDVNALREFQSYHESPTGTNAVFKPTPEGFKIAERRRRIPEGG